MLCRAACRLAYFLSVLLAAIIMVGIFSPTPCLGKEIDVALVWHLGEAGWVECSVVEGSYELSCGTFSQNLGPGSSFQVGWGGWAPAWRLGYGDFEVARCALQVVELNRGGVLQVHMPGGKAYLYRGGLTLQWVGDRWLLVNRVEEEDYLKGVVPIEMSSSWAYDGLEALKSQAVAARTYMVKHTQGGKRLTDSPDIDQAYLGKGVEGAASLAVEATRGQILIDRVSKKPIDAFYSSHNGGQTEDAANVWGNKDPHYSAHPDYYSRGVGGPEDHWRFIISAPRLGSTFGLGPVDHIELEKYPSGRIKNVKLEDMFGRSLVVSGRSFVKAFYPFGQPIKTEAFLSNLFDVYYYPSATARPALSKRMRAAEAWLGLRRGSVPHSKPKAGPRLERIVSSAAGIAPIAQAFGTFVFDGRGWGHGVGMSQWGAYHMAQLGYSYKDILSYYYEQVLIVPSL